MALSIRAEQANGTGRLVLDGELDLAEQDAIDAAFVALEELRPMALFVDLTALNFIDSTGLHALIRAHQHMQKDGRRLTLVGCGPAVQRVLNVSGLDTFFDCFDGSWVRMEQSLETWEPIKLVADAQCEHKRSASIETRRIGATDT